MGQDSISLLELNALIKNIISGGLERFYWVTGEITGMKVNASGHCYMELIQKDKEGSQVVARTRAIIWAQKFRLIKPYFETTTGQLFTEGISILVKVSVEYHEIYGLSLNITDIEPAFTVGEMALQRQKIIERLIAEGVFDMNREISLPEPCQKIAVISSPTAAGYEDFHDQLLNNPYGYVFYLKLFPAVMQGEEAESSVIAALDRIYSHESFFDTVAIIRGGGSQADLNCFNSYWLAYHITQFPLPVLTGIGHEQDDSVTDMVAHTRLKTPTAVAAFLIDRMVNLEGILHDTAEEIIARAEGVIDSGRSRISRMVTAFPLGATALLNRYRGKMMQYHIQLQSRSRRNTAIIARELDRRASQLIYSAEAKPREQVKRIAYCGNMIRQGFQHRLKQAQGSLDFFEKRLPDFDPRKVLERGYSITLKDGHIVKDASLLEVDDRIVTVLHKGETESVIKKNKL